MSCTSNLDQAHQWILLISADSNSQTSQCHIKRVWTNRLNIYVCCCPNMKTIQIKIISFLKLPFYREKSKISWRTKQWNHYVSIVPSGNTVNAATESKSNPIWYLTFLIYTKSQSHVWVYKTMNSYTSSHDVHGNPHLPQSYPPVM